MASTLTTRQERMEQLYANCQDKVLESILGPFGLSKAMFADKDGGNVATVHNAEQGIFPDEAKRENYKYANEEYSPEIRGHIDDRKERGKVYKETNKSIDNGDLIISDATDKVIKKDQFNVDHITPLAALHKDKSFNLYLTEDERKEIANHGSNLAIIESDINKSKRDKRNDQFIKNKENVKKREINEEKMLSDQKRSEAYIRDMKLKALGKDVLSSSANQAAKMAFRQSLGVLLVELVNGIFNEIKSIIKAGGNFTKREIFHRLSRVIKSTISKTPQAISQFFAGGISGFLSNILTALLNTFIATMKKMVTVIREGLIGLFRAFKMILFPPENMSKDDALREGIKILGSVIVTSLSILFEESILGFVKSIPFGQEISAVLMAIINGLLISFIVYQVDRFFDKKGVNEKMLENLIEDANSRLQFASLLCQGFDAKIELIKDQITSIDIYQRVMTNFTETSQWVSEIFSSSYRVKENSDEIKGKIREIKYLLNYL